MVKSITIKNYKSIKELNLELGKVNVFIGENGSGKSNILEAMVMASTAMGYKVENEQLALRGARTSDAIFYRSGFDNDGITSDISFELRSEEDDIIDLNLSNDNQPFSRWKVELLSDGVNIQNEVNNFLLELISQNGSLREFSSGFLNELMEKYPNNKSFKVDIPDFRDFMIYAPENYFLRTLNTDEPHLEPIGYRGEGLLNLISAIKKEKPHHYEEIVKGLNLIDWLDKFEIVDDPIGKDAEYKLTDRYLEDGIHSFDIRSANEGFLFLLFYLTLFISDYTPKAFAIDNIDTALNPKLCSRLISLLCELAKKYDKQVIITTHNPAILDGLNLNNEDERLFVISRGLAGNTLATRIKKKEPLPGVEPLKLSEQFLRGYIGGLPKNF